MNRASFTTKLSAAGWLIRSEDFGYEVLNDALCGGWTVSVIKQETLRSSPANPKIRLTAEIANVDEMAATLAEARVKTIARVQEWEALNT